MTYSNIREEELKNKVAQAYFAAFDCTKIVGNIDFCVAASSHNPQQDLFLETESLLWAEAKKGSSDLYKSIVQLILTIGKARTFDKQLPPAFLGAFDAEKIAFVPYNAIQEIFYQNDFNWNVTPSNHETKEFLQVYDKVKITIETYSLLFLFGNDDGELQEFIATNFVAGKAGFSKIQIDKNNFMVIYNKWLTMVKPTIMINWDLAQKNNIIDGDFYLADLLSAENESLKDNLYVLLKKDHYELDRSLNEMGLFGSQTALFRDKQKVHAQFWNKYHRPPKEEYWDYIVNRRDLLVPQDVRERKGSFYTPQIWVELSQKYLANVLGENWQDEYYIWDCAAGTGNLLAGLTNKYHIWASTLDRQDVDVMKDRIKNGANLLEKHVFQFDFLNDDFTKLPKELQEIINHPEKREKLVMYINPPYAEASNRDTVIGSGQNRDEVATATKVYKNYQDKIGTAARELFAQFLSRIYTEIPAAKLAHFSTLKAIQAPNFFKFRTFFKAEFQKGFVVPANSFDNVKGQFPIGFFIWDLDNKQKISTIECEVFDNKTRLLGVKTFYAYDKGVFIIDWLRQYYDKKSERIAYLRMIGTDMQNNRGVFFTNNPSANDVLKHLTANITRNNIIEMCIYLSVRHVIEQSWLTDRDQFLYPNEGWKTDSEFQNNCFAFSLFHGQNKMSAKEGGTNNWIPFSEYDVNAQEKFDSNFMSNFIQGKLKADKTALLIENPVPQRTTPLIFSSEAQAVFEAGLALWKYYHVQENVNVNASLYDIRAYFQGRNEGGKMKIQSEDETYNTLIQHLRKQILLLGQKIAPKVYEYGFLKG